MVPDAHYQLQDIFTTCVTGISSASSVDRANGANVLIYNGCLGLMNRATTGCREIAKLLGQYCANKDITAFDSYVAGLDTTVATIHNYSVTEVAMFHVKMNLVFNDVGMYCPEAISPY